MGYGVADLRFLLSAEAMGFRGRKICTLGKLTTYTTQRQLDAVLAKYGKPHVTLDPVKALYSANDLLEPLGYEVDSLDASDYEGASIVHDLNQPIPDKLAERYDLVIDGGTLEHVFNFPVAIDNAARMLKTGGHLFLVTPTNNQCGHGFYQFSPELFFSLLSEHNGFEMVRMYVTCKGSIYHVTDPRRVGGRVELITDDGAFLMVHAKKVRGVQKISGPQQSDYLVGWQATEQKDGRLKAMMRRHLSPDQVTKISKVLNKLRVHRAAARWKRRARLSNREFFIPVTDWTKPSASAFHQKSDEHEAWMDRQW